MTVTFQVGDREFGGSGNLDIDFWIQQPNSAYQIHQTSVSSGDHTFDATQDGRYMYCFSNENWSANSKEVSFNVHGIVYVPESEAPQDPLEREGMVEYYSPSGGARNMAASYTCLVTDPLYQQSVRCLSFSIK